MPSMGAIIAVLLASLPVNSRSGQSAPAGVGERAVGPHDVRQYGARGDGRSLDMHAIQTAIDAAAHAGGGTVHFPPGVYLTGGLQLAGNVGLHLEAGAVLLASTDIGDYTAHRSLIHAANVQNVFLTGEGTLDGQGGGPPGENSADTLRAARARGKLIDFARCRGVRVQGVTLRNSPSWMQHYFECEDVAIDGITVHNHCNLYNDGLDVDNCRDVRIRNCRISSGDDAIVLKSRSGRSCENITIADCVVSSHSNGIKIGTESHGGFRNITVANCIVVPVDPAEPRRNGAASGLGGITLTTVDGAPLENVSISNITIQGTIAPIFVRLGNRGRRLQPDSPAPPVGRLRNVTISRVAATGASGVGCAIAGLPGHPVESLTLSDISIEFGEQATRFVNYEQVAAGGTRTDVLRSVPEKADAYPECIMFGKLPAYGFYARHVDGLTLRNVRLRWTASDERPAILCDDVCDLSVEGLRARSGPQAAPVLLLRNTRTALIRHCTAEPGTRTFLGLEGDTNSVSLTGNDLTGATRASELGPGVPPGTLSQTGNAVRP